MYVENRTKIANFPTPVYLTPPMKGLPLEFGISVRGPECFYDGAIRLSKKFSDTFSRFDTIPAVTDSHPASHVTVAITLNAKASSITRSYDIGLLSLNSTLKIMRWTPTMGKSAYIVLCQNIPVACTPIYARPSAWHPCSSVFPLR